MSEEELKQQNEKIGERGTTENSITDNDELTEVQTKELSSGKKKKLIIAGCLILAVAVGGGCYAAYNANMSEVKPAIEEVKKIENPVIILYGEKLVTGVNVDVSVQEKLVKSITSVDKLKSFTIETEKKDDMVVTDTKGGKEKFGVPAKSMKFTKEGNYTVVVKAETVKGGKSESKVTVEVGGELVGYVKGIKDWTVELNAKNVDFMKDVTWDKEKVKGVTADSSKVNIKKEGTYDLVYTIKGTVVGQETSVTKKVDVKVLSEKEAKKEADKGNVVITSNGEVKKDSSGKVPTGEVASKPSNVSKPDNSGSQSKPVNGGSTSKPDNGGSQSKPDNGGSVSKPDNGGNATEKPSEPNKPEDKPSKPSEPEKPAHSHSWVDVTTVVNHPAEGHNEDYLISDAWSEGGDPIYEYVHARWCNACNKNITNFSESQITSHLKQHVMNDEVGGYREDTLEVQTGTTPIINHPAEYGTRWVVDKEAWSETVVTGQKCNGCGQTK